MKRITTIAVAILATCFVGVAFAHHSSAPHFDASKPIAITGVVTEFKFVNPHAYLYLDVTDSDGTVTNWNCEMTGATVLRRSGWTQDLFRPGTAIKIDGIAARRDPHGCSFETGTLADGTTIARNGPITRNNAAPPADRHIDHSVDGMTLAGTWQTTVRPRNGPPPGGAQGGGAGGPPGMERFADSLTEAGQAAADAYDMRFDDPALECSPSSIIRGWGEPSGISEIALMPDKVVIKHEYMDTVRVVDLTTRKHPTDIKRSLTGHSVGWFEDDTLVIDTVGFKAGVLLPHPGIMHTKDMRVVERLSLSDDGSQLLRSYEVIDPAYFREPYTGRSSWTRSNIPLAPYNCTELSGVSKIRTDATD